MLIFVSSASATDFRGVNDVITTVDRHHMYQTNYPANILSPADKTAARMGHEEVLRNSRTLFKKKTSGSRHGLRDAELSWRHS